MDPAYLFDTSLRTIRRERSKHQQRLEAGWLFHEAATSLADRLKFIRRHFSQVIFHGMDFGAFSQAFPEIQPSICLDGERETWPEKASGADLVLSNLQLHWVNDLPGLLIQIRRSLQPDGFFSACLLGGETLTELRTCLIETEHLCNRPHAPRLSPMIDLQTAASLMQRAGFALPVIDHEVIRTSFADPLKLLTDLRNMGQTNAISGQDRRILPKAFWPTFIQTYLSRFPDGREGITATFDLIFLSGWSPAASQQQPLQPGSAQMSLHKGLKAI